MGLASTLARRSLFQRPGRTLFSILGVAVGIATVVAVFTLDHITLLSRTWVDPSWKADLEVRASRGVDDPREALNNTPGVSGVSGFFQHGVMFRPTVAAGERSQQERVHMVAIDGGTGPAIGAYHVVDGRDVGPGAEGLREALVGGGLAREHGIEPGDSIYLARPARTARKVCREGEVSTMSAPDDVPIEELFTVVGIVSDEGVGRKSLGKVIVIDYAVGHELFRGAFVEPRFWLKRDPTIDIEDLGSNLGQSFSYELNKSVVVGEMEDERAFRNGVRMAGLLAMTLGLYVIFHTLSMSLIERVREVAVLNALGGSRSQVARVFFLEAVVIALTAGVVGFAGGLGLARFLLKKGITTLGVADQPVEIFEVPWQLVVPLALVGVAFALLGSVFPLMRARSSHTVAALRGEDLGPHPSLARGFHIFAAILLVGLLPALYFFFVPVVGAADRALVGAILAGLGVMAVLIALPLVVPSIVGTVCGTLARSFAGAWPLAGKLAARSIEQAPARIAASVAAIALVTSAYVGLKGMTNSLAAEVDTWGQQALVDKVFVSNLPNLPVDGVERTLHELPEVVAVESGDARTYVPFLLIGVRPDALRRFGPCADDPDLARLLEDEQGILVSERLARHRDIGVGDSIAINTSGHGVQTFTVSAITDEYGYFSHPDERIYGVIDDRHMDRYFCLDTTTTSTLAVSMKPDSDPDAVRAALFGRLPENADTTRIRFETGGEVLTYHLEDIERDFVLFDIILGLTALLAAIGVLNGQLLSALERSKELGVLRALGTSRRQIAGMVLLESCVLGGTGGLIGLAVGSALTPLVVKALQLISGLPLPQRSAGPYLAWCLMGALVLTALAGLYPIWRMSRLDAVRAVRTG
ncbi:MAG: FtsX-like permease family protein [Planctomycetota bacterium]